MLEVGHIVIEVNYFCVSSGRHGNRGRLFLCQNSELGYMVVEIDRIGVKTGIHGFRDRQNWCQKWDTW